MGRSYPDYIIARDISWLHFNERVLQEAEDPAVPLYDRIRFMGIFSNNLDEFYRVRIAGVRRFRLLKKQARTGDPYVVKPKRLLKEVQAIVDEHLHRLEDVFQKKIIPALEEQGIHLLNEDQYDDDQMAFAAAYFRAFLASKIDVQIVNNAAEAPFLENRKLYFAVELDAGSFAIVTVPTAPHRFLLLPSSTDIYALTYVDDVLRSVLPLIFGKGGLRAYCLKVSRDAELYLDEDVSANLLARLKESLGRRGQGLPTRVLYDETMPASLLERLVEYYGFEPDDLVAAGRYHNRSDFMRFPNPSSEVLEEASWPPTVHPRLAKAGEGEGIAEIVQAEDLAFHFPYQRFDEVGEWFEDLALDDRVSELRITLYRLAERSRIASALIQAARQGKRVVAFIEAKARFDEESNLSWGRRLEDAGVQVMYSRFPEIKVHTKLFYVEFTRASGLKPIAYLGTGNFNEVTARIYGDTAIITTHDGLVEDVEEVFRLLSGMVLVPKCKHLLVSPFTTRSGFMQMIDAEVRNAQRGLPAYMILKMNSLEDEDMVEALVAASDAGVQVKLIVRGICRLQPSVSGATRNIEVLSIVDRYLEHTRVCLFGNGGQERIFIASADWMVRNLDRRIEVVVPVVDEQVRKEIRTMLELQLADRQKARGLSQEALNTYLRSEEGGPRSQHAFYRYLADKSENAGGKLKD